ncbi:MAG: signal peptidase I, partial [Acidimicrobiales bacterium]|nr:signal peptidase I [Acidimicrobiales bacterium]
MTVAGGKGLAQELRRRSGPGLALLVWIYLYITVLLAAWLLVTSIATGWTPTVVTSGSMSPGLRIGDVILLDNPTGERLAQHTIVTFDHEGEQVAHRIFSVEADGYVTKGDANATPDTSSIGFSEVTGVGRFVVPLVGLPVVWLATGNTIAFAAWVLSIIGSLALVGFRRRSKTKLPLRALSTTPLRAIRSVRVVVGFLILTQFIVDPNRLDIGVGAVGRGGIVVTSLLVLAVTNLASITLSKTSDERQLAQLAIGELAIDTFLVVALTAATGTEGIGWVLFALPIIESATRFRISGALLHWMALTAFSLVTRIVSLNQQGVTSQELFADLEKQIDQLSVLLLVVIPGAYLAEQLLNDVWTQRRATDDALHQSQLLQRVVDTTNSVSRLGTDVLNELTSAVVELGFSSSDIVAFNANRWETLASSGVRLPAPGTAASTLRDDDVALTGAIVDRDDESEEERAALRSIGLQAVVRFDVQNDDDDTRLCIRAGLRATGQPAIRSIEALRLLANHASVALQNETL